MTSLTNTFDLLDHASELAKVGGWELDLRTNSLFWSRQIFCIYEIDPPIVPSVEQAIRFYAPESRPLIQAAVTKGIESGTPWDLELQLITAKGRTIWVRAQGSAASEQGKVVKIFGAFQDITDRKAAELSFLESQARTHLLVQGANVGLWDWDLATNDVYFSREWKRQLGYEDGEIPNRFEEWERRVHPADLVPTLTAISAFRDGRSPKYEAEFRICHKDGSYRWIFTQGDLVRNSAGQPVRMMGSHIDVTARKQAEAALRESEEKFRTLFETASDAIFLMQGDLFVDCNARTLEMFGCDRRDQIIGHPPYEFSPPIQSNGRSSTEFAIEKISAALSGQPQFFEWSHTRLDGSGFPAEVSLNRVVLSGGVMLQAIVRDITARRQSEDALRNSELRLRDAQSISHIGNFSWDAKTGRVTWSEELFRIYGQNTGEFEPTFESYIGSIHPDERPRILAALQAVMGSKGRFDHDYRIVFHDGTIRWVHARGGAVVDSDGNFCGIDGTCQDITDRKQAETALKLSDVALKSISQGVIISGVDGVVRSANAAFTSITGYTQEEVLGQSCRMFTARLDQKTAAAIRSSRQKEVLFSREVRDYRKDGTPYWNDLTISPVHDERGALTSFISVLRDVTARKQAESALRESEERFQYAIDATRDGLWDLNIPAETFYLSPQWLRLLDYEAADVPPTVEFFLSLVHPEDLGRLRRDFDEHLAGRTSVKQTEIRLRMRSGEHRWFLDRGKVVTRDDSGNPLRMVGTITDISERKCVEEANVKALASLRATLDSTADGILTVGLDQRIQSFNQPFLAMWRMPYEVISGRDDELALRTVLDQLADPEKFLEKVRYLYAHPAAESFDLLSFKDGRVFERFSRPMLVDGHPTGRVWSFRDITARRHAEEEKAKLQLQLQHAQKLESAGRLAGGVAHDFNNMLGVILANAEFALERLSPSDSLYSELIEIQQAAQRSAELTQQLLAYARKQAVSPKVLDLNECVTSSLKILQRLIGENIQVDWRPAANPWSIRMDPSQMHQILTNLCINARDAISDVGRITIMTANVVITSEYCVSQEDAAPGEYVRLTVSDTGCGMDSETLALIFEPFFTTKGVGSGTGLGLAMVYGAVHQNQGFITVASSPGKGTTFEVHMPRHVAETGRLRTEDQSEASVRGKETVLVVEDEPAILKATTRVLTAQGYTVLAACTPAEAIQIAKDKTNKIDLLVTDVVMPQMNGGELARVLSAALPHLRCLFMSGYPADVIAHRGVMDEEVHFIQKPFSIVALAAAVREVLDSKRK